MKLCVIGTGYVGLVGAAIFADWGNEVVGVDIDEQKIARIKAGDMPIYEPGLAEIVLENISEGRLSFTTSLTDGIRDAEVVFICVGTPQDDTGAADLSAVWAVAKEIGQNLNGYKVIVTKSTVPVGTNEKVKRIVQEHLTSNVEFDVASNPEFLREGSSVEDMRNTDRTVVGTENERAMDVMRRLYAHLPAPLVECDLRSAEMVKYASNSFLATKISFINEIGQLCERSGADVEKVAEGMGLDNRIGPKMLHPSIGYGGSCFPKDVAALYRTSTDQAYDFKLLRGVMEVNEIQKDNFVSKITYHYGKNLNGKTLAVLGLAFKYNTDDTRESPAIQVIKQLRGLGADIRVYDPEAMANAKKELGENGIKYCLDMYETLEGADALLLLTEWRQFATIDLDRVSQALSEKVIFDGRNLLPKDAVEDMGFTYYALGRPTNGIQKMQKDNKNRYFALLKNGDRH